MARNYSCSSLRKLNPHSASLGTSLAANREADSRSPATGIASVDLRARLVAADERAVAAEKRAVAAEEREARLAAALRRIRSEAEGAL